jgi:hypothetical protein
MGKYEWYDIQIAKGSTNDSPRNNFLKKENFRDSSSNLHLTSDLDFDTINDHKLTKHAFILDTGRIVDFHMNTSRGFNTERQLHVKTSFHQGDKFVDGDKWCLTFEHQRGNGGVHYLFSADLNYCIIVNVDHAISLGNVIKSIVRISIFSLFGTGSKCSSKLYKNIQCIRSKKKLTSITVCLSTSHVICIVLNTQVAQEKTVQILKINQLVGEDCVDVEFIREIKLSPILTYIRRLSFNQFGDKLIVESTKDFCIFSVSPGFEDKCVPFQGTNPFVTYNVSLRSELLVRDSHLELGSSIEIYEIKEKETTAPLQRQLVYTPIWKVTAEELGLERVQVFQVQSFTETLIFYNQRHTIHILNPFKKKIIHKLDLSSLNIPCQTSVVNWSCQEVYVLCFDYAKHYNLMKVFSLKPKFSFSLEDQSARRVLETHSLNTLRALELPYILRKKLGYF